MRLWILFRLMQYLSLEVRWIRTHVCASFISSSFTDLRASSFLMSGNVLRGGGP